MAPNFPNFEYQDDGWPRIILPYAIHAYEFEKLMHVHVRSSQTLDWDRVVSRYGVLTPGVCATLNIFLLWNVVRSLHEKRVIHWGTATTLHFLHHPKTLHVSRAGYLK